MLRQLWSAGLVSLALMLTLVPSSVSAELDTASWSALLGNAVNEGFVDYGQWIDNADFDALVDQVAAADVSNMTREEKLVFYINSYNILAARGILNGSSPSSLLGRYVYFKRDKYQVAGDVISLHELEHERIRPLDEPRIHFAIVCASISCPILQSQAYTVERLDAQLDAAATGFINDNERNRFYPVRGEAELSSIFKWFKEDFVDTAGSLQAYIATYVAHQDSASLLKEGDFEVDYLPYDWSLNGKL